MLLSDPPVQPWPPAFSEDFLRDAQQTLADRDHVMVVGPLGSNRGQLAVAIAGHEAPTAWGRDVHPAGTPDVRFGALRQLMPRLDVRDEQTEDEVVSAAETVLDRTFGRPVMVLREADLSDDGSNEVLVRLVRSGRIQLVTTVGPAAADTMPCSGAARIELQPLDDDAVAHLLESRFGAPPTPTTVSMLVARSQGAYAVLKELADAGFRTGQLKIMSGLLVTDDSVTVDTVDEDTHRATRHLSPRFSESHPARDLIDVAALTMTLDAEEADQTFGPEAVSAAIALGAVHPRGEGELAFTSRAEAMTVRRSLGRERRLALYERYADHLRRSVAMPEVSPRAATWFMSVDRPVSADLAVRAATQANRECRYTHALRYVDAIPEAERTSRLQVEQAHALHESGALDQLAALLRSTDAALLSDDDLFVMLRLASRAMAADELDADKQRIFHRSDDSRLAVQTLGRLFVQVYDDGSADARRQLRALIESGLLSPVNTAMAGVALASSLRHAGQADLAAQTAHDAVEQLRATGDDACAANVETAMEVHIRCLITAVDFDGARRALTEYSAPGIAYGNAGRLGTALWGLLAFFVGDIRSALANTQLCLSRLPSSDPHGLRAWIDAMAAQVVAQVGEIDAVYHLLDASYEQPPLRSRQLDLECQLTRACVHDAIGEPEEALQILLSMIEVAREHDLHLQEVDAAVLCVQMGGTVHLPQLLRAVDYVDDSMGTSTIWRTFAWAIRDNDMAGLAALAEDLDGRGLKVFGAEVAQFTLDIARRAADLPADRRARLGAIADPMSHRSVGRNG